MRVIIVDDEDLARQVLREHLARHPDVELVAECANGFEAVKAIMELRPDLVFLDIQMPKLNGFEVLELLDKRPSVIFVTAYDSFALEAFDVHAIDYLLKPFSLDRFTEALQQARGRMKTTMSGDVAGLLHDTRIHQSPLERILIRDAANVLVVPVNDVDYIEAQDDYVSIHAGSRKHLKQERLSVLEAALEPRRFVRIHRSYILNIERLSRLEAYAKESRVAILKDGTQLPVSRAGFERLRLLL